MTIKTESINLLKQRIDLKELISEYVDLKKSGSGLVGLCPFHDEKTPSFYVDSDRYHCFGCSAHGDGIQFLVDHLGFSFPDAIESLADRYGVLVERTQQAEHSNRKPIFDVLNAVADVYHGLLLHTEAGHKVLQYLYNRGIDLDMIRRFKLGFVPDKASSSKLWVEKGGGMDPYKAGMHKDFSERLAFPISDPMGHVIGFSCRTWWDGQDKRKYINSHETEVFKKSHCLYGIDISRKRMAKERVAILVEGYTDVIRLVSIGYDITVAPMGTAFTQDQARTLKRTGVDRTYIVFDGDTAGKSATLKTGLLLQNEGVEPLVVELPDGEDVDSFVLTHGDVAFQNLLNQSSSFVPFLVKQLFIKHGDSAHGKSKVCKECVDLINGLKDPILLRGLKREVANTLGLSEMDVLGVSSDRCGKVLVGVKRALQAEQAALCAVLAFPCGSTLLDLLDMTNFENSICQRVFDLLKDSHQKGLSREDALSKIDDEGLHPAIPFLASAAKSESLMDVRRVVLMLKREVTLFRLGKKRRVLKSEIRSGSDASSTVRDIKSLERELDSLG